jgi:hypothetical protein
MHARSGELPIHFVAFAARAILADDASDTGMAIG